MAADYAGWTHGNLTPTDDSDQDGMPNLVEYAMGGDPTTADTVPFFCSTQGTNYCGRLESAQSYERSNDCCRKYR